MKIKVTHKIVVIGFIFSLLFNLILPSMVLVEFKMNQDFIAENLCVEKEIIESTCNGKCQLKKELKKVEKKSEDPYQSKLAIESEISALYYQEINKITLLDSRNINPIYFQVKSKPLSGFNQIVFRPPIS